MRLSACVLFVLAAGVLVSAADSDWSWLLNEPDISSHGVKARAGVKGGAASAAAGVDVYSNVGSVRLGLFATSDIAAGETIIAIPTDRLFHPSRINDPIMNSFLNYTKDNSFLLDQRVVLAVGLLQQYLKHVMKQHIFGDAATASAAGAKHSTVWDRYFSSLDAVPSTVMFYDEFELNELQLPEQSPLFNAREQQLEYISEMYKFVSSVFATNKEFAALFPKDTFTEKWFSWAYATVLNRGIELPLLPWSAADSSIVVLAPFIDLVNHANPPHQNAGVEIVRGTERTKSHIRFVANRAIAAGAQITVSYSSFFPLEPAGVAPGAAAGETSSAAAAADATRSVVPFPVHGYSNTQLLVHFGFALPINEYEHISLDIGFDDSHAAEDPLFTTKDRILNLNALSRTCLVSVDGRLPPAFMHSLRVKQLTRDDLRRLSYFNYQFMPENGFFSLQNELRVQLQLLASVEELLRGYPTTLNKDMETAIAVSKFVAAASATATATASAATKHLNLPQVINYRMSVKRVLHVLILRSLSSLTELFTNLTARWTDDLTAAINKLPPLTGTAATGTATDAAAGTGTVEVPIAAHPSAADVKFDFLEPNKPGAATGAGAGAGAGAGTATADTDRAWTEWNEWRTKMVEWRSSLAAWKSEYAGWVKQSVGSTELPESIHTTNLRSAASTL